MIKLLINYKKKLRFSIISKINQSQFPSFSTFTAINKTFQKPKPLVFQPTKLRRKSQNPSFITNRLLLWFPDEGFGTKQLWRRSPTVCGKQNDFGFCYPTIVL